MEISTHFDNELKRLSPCFNTKPTVIQVRFLIEAQQLQQRRLKSNYRPKSETRPFLDFDGLTSP